MIKIQILVLVGILISWTLVAASSSGKTEVKKVNTTVTSNRESRLGGVTGGYGLGNGFGGLGGWGLGGIGGLGGLGSGLGVRPGLGFGNGLGIWGLRPGRNGQNAALYSNCDAQTNSPGICLSNAECLRGRGTAVGSCFPLGVCCYTSLQCNDNPSSAKRVEIIRSRYLDGNGVQETGTCLYKITPFSQNVCQLRIEFTTVIGTENNPTPPSNSAEFPKCGETYVKIGNVQYCGTNSRQHVYLPFTPTNQENGVIFINRPFESNDFWKITVTQIECPTAIVPTTVTTPVRPLFRPIGQNNIDNIPRSRNYDLDLIAPSGCDQFFLEPQGTIRSFNFNGGVGPYPQNLKYTICIRRLQFDVGITYNFTTFSLGSNPGQACFLDSIIEDPLSEDYLSIASQQPIDHLNALQYCGDDLDKSSTLNRNQNPILTSNNPGVFAVHFNSGMYIGDPTASINRAFEFHYEVQ